MSILKLRFREFIGTRMFQFLTFVTFVFAVGISYYYTVTLPKEIAVSKTLKMLYLFAYLVLSIVAVLLPLFDTNKPKLLLSKPISRKKYLAEILLADFFFLGGLVFASSLLATFVFTLVFKGMNFLIFIKWAFVQSLFILGTISLAYLMASLTLYCKNPLVVFLLVFILFWAIFPSFVEKKSQTLTYNEFEITRRDYLKMNNAEKMIIYQRQLEIKSQIYAKYSFIPINQLPAFIIKENLTLEFELIKKALRRLIPATFIYFVLSFMIFNKIDLR